MNDEIYLIDPTTRASIRRGPVRFSDVGIQERADLQEWILGRPEILGEDLLIVTSEFGGFDRSNRRLDVLGLDRDCNLVVIELKLELKQTFADLQALRYAAFCATMTADQVVDEFARYHRTSREDAAVEIGDFLSTDPDDLPEPSDRPRIILVAGSLDEPEVVSTVLWLRNFGQDIRCLELTPYQVAGEQIILVPRLIVPLPEAEEYQVRVERKESERAKKSKSVGPYIELWRAITREFGSIDTPFEITRQPARSYLQVAVGEGGWHYEWQAKKRADELHVAVHFESSDRSENQERLALLESVRDELHYPTEARLELSEWGKKWAYCAFILPLGDTLDDIDQGAREAAQLMDHLMRKTYDVLAEG